MERFTIKSILKFFKLNESLISTFLGAVVILVVGVLVFNYFRNLRSQEGEILPGTKTGQGLIIDGEGNKVYEVKAGDSLWKIAETLFQSGYNWVDIAEANSLVSPGLIEEGQRLVIPNVEPRQTTVTETEAPLAISGDTYEVDKGDSLWEIAVRAYGDGYRWAEIAEANNLENPDMIHAGNILRIPR